MRGIRRVAGRPCVHPSPGRVAVSEHKWRAMMKQRSRRISAALTTAALVVAAPGIGVAAERDHPAPHGAALARLGAPAAAGTFAGPDSPESFNATLPNGRRVTPAGVSVQVGQNPLNSVLT